MTSRLNDKESVVSSEPKKRKTRVSYAKRKSLNDVVKETKEAKENTDALDKALQY